MKRIIALLLVCCALFGLVACGNTDEKPNTNPTESTTEGTTNDTTESTQPGEMTDKNEENTTNSESNNNSSEGSNNNGQQNTDTPTQTPVTPEINNDSVPNIVPNIPNVEVEKDKAIKGEAQFTVIPEGGTYKTADGKTLVAGDAFPIAPASGDTFFYNGFKYVQGGFILNNQFCARYKNMWFVYANKSGIENLDDSCTSINGQTVTLRTATDLDFQ